MKEITIKVPDMLSHKMESLVESGWFLDINEIFLSAVRLYLETHSHELLEKFILEDIEWGLRGNE